MSAAETQPKNDSPAPGLPPRKGGHGCLWTLLFLGVLVLAAYGLHRRYPQVLGGLFQRAATPAAPPGARSVAVAVAQARRGDLPIYLDAPGTVVALDTVNIRARVDGQIMKVNFVEGAVVKAGDLLIEIDPRPFQAQLLQAQGQLARDEALLQNAKLDLARYQGAGRAATQQQIDTARAAVGQYEGAVKADQGAIENVNLQLTYCRITAPVGGRIGLRQADPGNIVHANDTGGLAVIARVEPTTVIFSLAQDFLPQILRAMGGKELLPVMVLGRDKSTFLTTGTLAAVDSQIDPQTLTARFKAVCPNRNHILFANQAVNVRLLVNTLRSIVLVPTAAVQRGPQSNYAYIVGTSSTVEMRPIQPGPVEGDVASIERGLAPGETVVTAGVDNLAPGMKVTVPAGQAAPAVEGSPKGMSP